MRLLLTGLIIMAAVAGGTRTHADSLPDGLYAGFSTTLGNFVCRLDYEHAPRTVANFVGLTEGTKAWLDLETANVVKRPFFDGLTFHRVIKNFVIQTGSKDASGSDDPGYRFNNEVNPVLKHSKAGILAMANSGGTNSNGSQFYVTLAPQPSLDGKYSVFGEVVSGMETVQAIGAVPTNASDKPTNSVFLIWVSIARIGAAAQAFDPAKVTPALPDPVVAPASVENANPGHLIKWDYHTNSVYRLFYTANFKDWGYALMGDYKGTYLDTLESIEPYSTTCFMRVYETRND